MTLCGLYDGPAFISEDEMGGTASSIQGKSVLIISGRP